MKFEKGDYLIVSVNEKSNVLAKVTRTDPLRAVVADKTQSSAETTKSFEFSDRDVRSNLGPKPKFGSVYGVTVEPWHYSAHVDDYGDIVFYRKVSEETRTSLFKQLNRFAKHITEENLTINKTFEITIREPKGRWLGYYKYHKKKETQDEICYRPVEFGSKSEMEYLFAHEHAHGLWFNNMTAGWRARWVKMYRKQVLLATITPDRLDQLRIGLLENQFASDHMKSIDDEDKLVMKEIYRYIGHRYYFDKLDIEDLIQSNDDLKTIWPSKIDLSSKEVAISEYAMTNPKEFFAEAFAFTWTKKEVPKSVRKLMEKTLEAIKSGMTETAND